MSGEGWLRIATVVASSSQWRRRMGETGGNLFGGTANVLRSRVDLGLVRLVPEVVHIFPPSRALLRESLVVLGSLLSLV